MVAVAVAEVVAPIVVVVIVVVILLNDDRCESVNPQMSAAEQLQTCIEALLVANSSEPFPATEAKPTVQKFHWTSMLKPILALFRSFWWASRGCSGELSATQPCPAEMSGRSSAIRVTWGTRTHGR